MCAAVVPDLNKLVQVRGLLCLIKCGCALVTSFCDGQPLGEPLGQKGGPRDLKAPPLSHIHTFGKPKAPVQEARCANEGSIRRRSSEETHRKRTP